MNCDHYNCALIETTSESGSDDGSDDGFENCDCGYIHHYEDKCPQGKSCAHYEKWRKDECVPKEKVVRKSCCSACGVQGHNKNNKKFHPVAPVCLPVCAKMCVVCYVEKSTCEIGVNCKTCKNPMCFVCCCEYFCANPNFHAEGDETGSCVDVDIPCPMCRTINVFCV